MAFAAVLSTAKSPACQQKERRLQTCTNRWALAHTHQPLFTASKGHASVNMLLTFFSSLPALVISRIVPSEHAAAKTSLDACRLLPEEFGNQLTDVT